ncbi:TcfC E-set like domain-containing protein [Qipengyuania gaetbuli]|uniref:TcfC E-set like domain-containing protein n=1 Tax=Qipengyuania gaetbuli TaxID=266952 RepID=UPI001CD51788|nr:TcfC E-set like domain-containing protein [Qipengyuania gaetbuli]MCA0911046.1 TcfC E-set like domain-containing protein [Qipengyuania gaetbuli]
MAALFALLTMMFGYPSPVFASSFQVTAPAGFEDLEDDQEQILDVYFEGRLIGLFEVTVNPQWVVFSDPDLLLAQLPETLRTDDISHALRSRLPRNQDRACSTRNVEQTCGLLEPETVGIIHYADRFEIHLFVNSELRRESAAPLYLPAPDKDFALASTISFLASGYDGGEVDFSGNADTIASVGDIRFQNSLVYSDRAGLQVEEARGEIDQNDVRYYGGLFWARSSTNLRRARVAGIGISSQLDTRLDRETLIGTPINIYLRSRGRVEVSLGGRILYAANLPAGSTQIDTASFPSGNYEIQIEISESGAPPRLERRFFSKSRSIPPPDHPFFFAEAGLEVPYRTSLLRGASLSEKLTAQTGAIFRLTENWALGAGAQYQDKDAGGRVMIAYLGTEMSGEAAVGMQASGAQSASISLASMRGGAFNYSFDLRHVSGSRVSVRNEADLTGDYTQAGGSISWVGKRLRLGLLGNYRDMSNSYQYAVTGTANYDIVRRSYAIVSLVGEYSTSSFGEAYFVGVNLRMFGSRGGAGAAVGYRRQPADDEAGIFSEHYVNGSLGLGEIGQIEAQAAFETGPGRDALSTAMEFTGQGVSLRADVLRAEERRSSRTQFALGGATTLLLHGDQIANTVRASRESTLLLNVNGAREVDEFEILIDGQSRGSIQGGERATLTVPSYRSYEVRLKARASGPLQIENDVRKVSVYPGNIRELNWSVKRLTAIVGQLVTEDGTLLARAFIRSGREVAVSDEMGYFQLETSPGQDLEISGRDGARYITKAPDFEQSEDLARVGKLVVQQAEEKS